MTTIPDYLMHYGVKGMKKGIRNIKEGVTTGRRHRMTADEAINRKYPFSKNTKYTNAVAKTGNKYSSYKYARAVNNGNMQVGYHTNEVGLTMPTYKKVTKKMEKQAAKDFAKAANDYRDHTKSGKAINSGYKAANKVYKAIQRMKKKKK